MNKETELLINIPADTSDPVTFYGLENNKEKVVGAMPVDAQNPDLFKWLK